MFKFQRKYFKGTKCAETVFFAKQIWSKMVQGWVCSPKKKIMGCMVHKLKSFGNTCLGLILVVSDDVVSGRL